MAGQSMGLRVRSLLPGGKPCRWLCTALQVQQGAPPELGGRKSQYLTCTGGRRKWARPTPPYWPKGQGIWSEARQSQLAPLAPSGQVLPSVGAKAPAGLPSTSQPPAAPVPPLFTSCSLLLTSSHLAFAFQHWATAL